MRDLDEGFVFFTLHLAQALRQKRGATVTQKTLVRLFALVSIIALPACGALVSKQLSAPEEIVMSKLDVNKYPINKVVCDPMGGDNDPRSNAGLKAELYWLGANAAAPTNTSDLIARGTKSDRSLFFTQLNTPTRLFDMGFNNSLGQPIQDDTGNKLIERFALRFKSVLRLAQRRGVEHDRLFLPERNRRPEEHR